MKTLVRMKYGSHLYGTNTPSSDQDFKGIFIPSADEILKCRVPRTVTFSQGNGDKQKNTSHDVDDDMYSLPYFLQLALQGETCALDMLHADDNAVIECIPDLWKELRSNRHRFYTNNMKGYFGYAKKQAAKYGIKGSRLEAARSCLAFLMSQGDKKISEVYAACWEDEHCKKYTQGTNLGFEEVWEVCGKKFMGGTRCSTYVPVMQKFYKQYGERARMAEANQGVDWKAVSHALRAGYQMKHILLEGDYSYPLPETNFLKQVKAGALSYLGIVAPALENLMDEVDSLAKQVRLQKEPDEQWTMEFMKKCHLEQICSQFKLSPME